MISVRQQPPKQITVKGGPPPAPAWNPGDEGDALSLWYRTDTVVLDDDTPQHVTSWTDKSGNGNDLVTCGDPLPVYASSDPDFGGQPSLGTINGVDEVRALAIETVDPFVPAASTWFHVFRIGAEPGDYVFLRLGGGSFTNCADLYTPNGTQLSGGDGGGFVTADIETEVTYVVASVYDGAGNVSLYVNDPSAPAVTGVCGAQETQILFTGTYFGQASRYREAEIFAVARTYDHDDLVRAFNYCNARYGL